MVQQVGSRTLTGCPSLEPGHLLSCALQHPGEPRGSPLPQTLAGPDRWPQPGLALSRCPWSKVQGPQLPTWQVMIGTSCLTCVRGQAGGCPSCCPGLRCPVRHSPVYRAQRSQEDRLCPSSPSDLSFTHRVSTALTQAVAQASRTVTGLVSSQPRTLNHPEEAWCWRSQGVSDGLCPCGEDSERWQHLVRPEPRPPPPGHPPGFPAGRKDHFAWEQSLHCSLTSPWRDPKPREGRDWVPAVRPGRALYAVGAQ